MSCGGLQLTVGWGTHMINLIIPTSKRVRGVAGEKEWMYRSTAERQYGHSRHQLQCAIKDGMIEAREVENPHYKSGPSATLVKINDIEANLDKIKAYPRSSVEEKRQRKTYRQRMKLRDELEFFCPRCKRNIRALRGSRMFEACYYGDASVEEARKTLMIAHYRHEHTNYHEAIEEEKDERYERYRELRDSFDFDTAWMIVDDEFGELDFKADFTKKAIELLKEDGLLVNSYPEDQRM